MAEAGFARRVAPAVGLAVAGGILLYLLPTGPDNDTAADEDIAQPESSSTPSAKPSGKHSGRATATPSQNVKRTIQGDAVDFRFGTVQVTVALDGTTIANIATDTAPGGSYQSYTDRAIPEMKTRILAAQSTRVAAVSGATYTSQAYAQSVQSALDRS
jgi:uncharacterized protein with FMN-binding domain